ncbi:MAG: DUF4293 domain-containing protein [Flavobacteriales bacterium]
MIQRKQSLFLALAALCVGLMFLFNISVHSMPDQVEEVAFSVMGMSVGGHPALFAPKPLVPLGALAGIAIAICVFTIFLFNDRKRQVRFANFCYMVLLALFAAVFMSEHSMAAFVETRGGAGNVRVAYFLPLLALACVFLAVRGIKADEALVKSADRLR